MPVTFEGQSPQTPHIFRIRLVCDICAHQSLLVEVPTDYVGACGDHMTRQSLMTEALRYVEHQGWLWHNPDQASQVVTCSGCARPASFIHEGVQVGDIVPRTIATSMLSTIPRIVTDPSVPRGTIHFAVEQGAFIANPSDEGRYRQEIEAMFRQAEGDPDFQVLVRADIPVARVGQLALPWNGSTPHVEQEVLSAESWAATFRQEVMGEFLPNPEPPDRPDGVEVQVSGGTFVDQQGNLWRAEPSDPRVVVGVDPAIGEDVAIAQVIIDGQPTGHTVRLRKDHMKAEPVRKSIWERLMEDDDETCP